MVRLARIALIAGNVLIANVLIANVPMGSTCMAQDGSTGGLSATDLFNQRIMPIFKSPEPSSCVQCHLASVDLKNYILPSQEQTFASLRDQGLINLAAPEKSKILTLIAMGEKDLDEGARLIHAKTRRAEYEAFAAWIKACCDDPQLRALPELGASEWARPEKPDDVIRHSRKSRVLDSFIRNVWSQRMRCFPCHTPHEVDPSNPRQQAAVKTLNKFEQELPKETLDRLTIFRETPEATLQYLVKRSGEANDGEIPLLDLETPRKSLIVLKPTSKLPKKRDDGTFEPPSSQEPVSHLGGLKMHQNDQSYKSFVAWIQDYANLVRGRYASAKDLPADNWYASKCVLRVSGAPEDWPIGVPVQLFLHAWNEKDKTWKPEPIAFTQGTVTPRRIVNGSLFLLAGDEAEDAQRWDRENATLPRGRYLVKVYVDSRRRLVDDPTSLLGEEEFYGQAELERPRWREGFRHAETISGKSLRQR